MNQRAVQLFFSLLALLALAGAVAIVICRLLARRVPAARAFVETVSPYRVPLAFVVAATAMAGSLYYSESVGLVPCKLCWYQRTAMYPLALILLVATIKRDPGVRRYAIPLAVVGAVTSSYHQLVEWFPNLETSVCSLDVPCSTYYFRRLGFVTLSFMALCGFLAIIALLSCRSQEET
jgi:Disulfide bond formation protein DsbB